jgi:hypothetical protein
MNKVIWMILTVIALGLAGWGVFTFTQRTAPQSPDNSVLYEAQSRDHIEPETEHPAYNSNPPSGGWHYSVTAKKKYYTEPIPDGHAIHNLEHGDIWITYHPRISAEAKDALKQYAYSKILITPRPENDKDIALVAWEHVDAFNLEGGVIPDERIRDFIKRYRNKGPEKIPAGAMEATFN